MKNPKTRLAVLLLSTLCLFTGAYGQVIPGRKLLLRQRQPATSGPIVQEQEAANLPNFTVLYTFTEGADGGYPEATVIGDKEGNLYGTTSNGGNDNCSSFAPGCGVVFTVDEAGNETVLYAFCPSGGNCTDGASPFAGLTPDAKGNLYSTTESGGSGSAGTVFKLEPPAQPGGTWTEIVLHSFCSAANCADGNYPTAGVIRHGGNLYGTTFGGGPSNNGVVFKMDPTGNEKVLYTFCPSGGNCTDGASPNGLIHDAAGNLYGTTLYGGANGEGTVFKLSPTGTETVLYSFAGGADGALPFASLIRDKAGNLYGTTFFGGASDYGTVFKVDPTGNETVLYSFTGGTDGGYSEASLIRDEKGNLYGTTYGGGLACSCGVVFKLDPAGKETVLYSFTGGADGENPPAGLTWGKAGTLYGTTQDGGDDSDPICQGCGVVFKLTPQ